MHEWFLKNSFDAGVLPASAFVGTSCEPHRRGRRDALEHQVRLMFSGSHIYKPSMTIAEVARHYTTTDPAIWALSVAAHLGVTVATRLEQITQNGNAGGLRGAAFSKN